MQQTVQDHAAITKPGLPAGVSGDRFTTSRGTVIEYPPEHHVTRGRWWENEFLPLVSFIMVPPMWLLVLLPFRDWLNKQYSDPSAAAMALFGMAVWLTTVAATIASHLKIKRLIRNRMRTAISMRGMVFTDFDGEIYDLRDMRDSFEGMSRATGDRAFINARPGWLDIEAGTFHARIHTGDLSFARARGEALIDRYLVLNADMGDFVWSMGIQSTSPKRLMKQFEERLGIKAGELRRLENLDYAFTGAELAFSNAGQRETQLKTWGWMAAAIFFFVMSIFVMDFMLPHNRYVYPLGMAAVVALMGYMVNAMHKSLRLGTGSWRLNEWGISYQPKLGMPIALAWDEIDRLFMNSQTVRLQGGPDRRMIVISQLLLPPKVFSAAHDYVRHHVEGSFEFPIMTDRDRRFIKFSMIGLLVFSFAACAIMGYVQRKFEPRELTHSQAMVVLAAGIAVIGIAFGYMIFMSWKIRKYRARWLVRKHAE